jgi:DNA-directed RNA polymerase subunit L
LSRHVVINFDEKNGIKVNEMSEGKTMARVENVKTANKGYELACELLEFPVTFVNAIRRICLASIPTVVIRDVQILENTSQMPHEMLKHRVEMLPVNVKPDDSSAIRDAKIEVRILRDNREGVLEVTTDDFVVESNRGNILMKDRDYNTPILFLRLRPNEGVHITGRLALESQGVSQVCVSTTQWHIDPERAKVDRKKFVEAGGDPALFDNFEIQKSFSRNEENGRPNWFDLKIESVGVLTGKEIVKYSVDVLRNNLQTYMKEAIESITREKEEGTYSITLEQGGHTMGALIQEVVYNDLNVDFVSYDIPHPLRNTMVLRFHTKRTPESILKAANETIEEYCRLVEKAV